MRRVHLVEQSTKGSCGPASLAMIAGTTEREMIDFLGSKHFTISRGMTTRDMLWALKKLEITCSGKWSVNGLWYVSPKALLVHEYIRELNGKHPIWAHFVVYYNGKFYDPGLGVRSEWFHPNFASDWQKITAYVEIYD